MFLKFWKSKNRPFCKTSIAFLQLTLMSCIVCLFNGPQVVIFYVPPLSRYHRVLCKTWFGGGFLWGFMTASTYGLVSLTLDRFLKIMHPFWSRKHYTRPLRVCLLVLPWILGPAFQIGVQISMSKLEEGECVLTVAFDAIGKVMQLSVSVVEFYFPLVIILAFYSGIIWRLKKNATKMVKYKTQGKMANRFTFWLIVLL